MGPQDRPRAASLRLPAGGAVPERAIDGVIVGTREGHAAGPAQRRHERWCVELAEESGCCGCTNRCVGGMRVNGHASEREAARKTRCDVVGNRNRLQHGANAGARCLRFGEQRR